MLIIFLFIFQNCSVTFLWIEYGKSQTHLFSAQGPETEEKIKLVKNKICFVL